jgi:hypothetical protein
MHPESTENVPTAYPVARTATLRGYAVPTYPIITSRVTDMGLDRVELSTSRLSGTVQRKQDASVDGESRPLTASRPPQRESRTRQESPSARTRGVTTKADGSGTTGKRSAVVRPLLLGGGNCGFGR